MGSDIEVELKKNGERPVSYSISVDIDTGTRKESMHLDVYEAFIPKLQQLLHDLEVI